MGCTSAKHVATVQSEEEAQKGKNYQNGDVFGDEYRIKPVEEVKYMKNGTEDEQKVETRNQENLEIILKGWIRQMRERVVLSFDSFSQDTTIMKHKGFIMTLGPTETLEKSASSNTRLKTGKEVPGLVHQPRANMHISESQQEFFRMLDEKIEKGRDYCSEEEDVT